jgi:hypothetical protein
VAIAPELLLICFTGRRQITKVKVDIWLSIVYFQEKIFVKKQCEYFYICIHHGLCEYMQTLWNGVKENVDIKFSSHDAFQQYFGIADCVWSPWDRYNLIRTCALSNKLLIFRCWAYLITVIPETRRANWIWYQRFL